MPQPLEPVPWEGSQTSERSKASHKEPPGTRDVLAAMFGQPFATISS